MVITFSDDFTGDNGPISGRTLNNALGGSEIETWVNAGNVWSIVSNGIESSGSPSIAIVSSADVVGVRARIHLPSSGGRPALIARCKASGLGPCVFLYVSTSYDSLHLREVNDEDIYGTNRDNASFTAIAGDAEYVMQLNKSGSIYTGYLYESDGATLIASVNYDFGETTFSNVHWGVTNYDGANMRVDDAVFYVPDAPPEGGGLLLKLMQHGQLNGGLL